MPVEFAENTSAYRGKGTVWLASSGEPDRAGEGIWEGYWDLAKFFVIKVGTPCSIGFGTRTQT
jgi:hypothetical protein